MVYPVRKSKVKYYRVIGDYYYLRHRVVGIKCYFTDEGALSGEPFPFVRYWVVEVLENGGENKTSFECAQLANQCFLYHKKHCGIKLVYEGVI